MCGITGILERQRGDCRPELIERMTTARSPGPDEKGSSSTGRSRSAIAGSRSSISLRRATSRWRTAGDLVITYNGEIYNFRELRAELERPGTGSSPDTDTEVILHAYEEWGDAARALQRHVRVRVWDRATAAVFLRATGTGSSRSTTRAGRATSCSVRRSNRSSSTRRPVEASLPHCRVLHLPERPHRRDAVRGRQAASPPGHRSRWPTEARLGSIVLGLPLPRGQPGSTDEEYARSSTALPAGGRSPARQRRPRRGVSERRHGLRLDHGPRGRGFPY